MAPKPLNRVAWQYHSDDSNTYRVAAEKALTDQGVLGGEAWDGTTKAKPANIKMRRITVSASGVGSRVVPVYDTSASILAENTSISVTFGGDSHTMLSSGNPIPEGHLRKSVTRQSS